MRSENDSKFQIANISTFLLKS